MSRVDAQRCTSVRPGRRKLALVKPGHLYLTKGEPVSWRRAAASDALLRYVLAAAAALKLVRHKGKQVPLPQLGDRFDDRTWRGSRGESAVLIPPQNDLAPADRTLRGPKRVAFVVRTGDGWHDIAVPAVDMPLVRVALVT